MATWQQRKWMPAVTAGVFIAGVSFLLIALLLEYREMHLGLKTIDIEIQGALKDRRRDCP